MKQLKRFYQLIFERPWSFVAHVSLLSVATILANARSFFIGWLTELITRAEYEQIFGAILIFGGCLILSTLLTNLAYYLQNKNVTWVSCTLLKRVMEKIHQLDFSFHASKSSGKLLSILNRGDDAVFVFYEGINDELLIVLISFIVMGISFATIGGKYILLVVGFVAVTCLVSYFILVDNLRKRKEFNREDDNLTATKVDNLLNFDTVKYFAKEKFELKRLDQVLKRWSEKLLKFFNNYRIFDLATNGLIAIFVVVIGLVAFADFQKQAMTAGEFVFILSFAISVLPQIVQFLHVIRHLARKSDDLNNYLKILDEKVNVPDPLEPKMIQNRPGTIEFNQVSFAYNKKHQVIKDFNLQIKPGEAVALVGFSGAGKTTIAKLLMRMYDVSSGEIKIDGIDIREMKKDYLRSLVGIVPQEPLMFNNSVYYNIAYSDPEASRDEVLEASALAQTDQFITNLSEGYETVVGERGIKLSGGQRQRLAIARVLLQGAQIVIFDEATSSLDSQAEQAVQSAFWQMAKDKRRPVTSIIIAHRLSTIMRADRIVVMDDGVIAQIGTHEELLRDKKGIYAHLWQLQQDGFIGDGE